MFKKCLSVAAVSAAIAGSSVLGAQPLLPTTPAYACNAGATFASFPASLYACGGQFAGNDSNQEAGVIAWLSAAWTNSPNSPATGGGYADPFYLGKYDVDKAKLELGDDGEGYLGVPTNSTINFSQSLFGKHALVLKGGNMFSIYLFDFAAPTMSVSYAMTGVTNPNNGNNPGLSHVSLWRDGEDPQGGCVGCVDVPEPSSLALVFGGLLGLGVASRRRRNS